MELRESTRRALRWFSAAVRRFSEPPTPSYLISYPKSGCTWFSYLYIFYRTGWESPRRWRSSRISAGLL